MNAGQKSGAVHRRPLVPQPHGGAIGPPWQPGESGNPSGRPKGYVDAATAYALVAALPYADAVLIADGKRPKGWHEPEVTMQYVRAARELLSTKGNAVELNARMDGPLNQAVEKPDDAETKAILAFLATLPPLPAQRREPGEQD